MNGAARSLPASPRSRPAATRPGTPPLSSRREPPSCSSRVTSPTCPTCSCATPIGRSCSTTSRRRPWRRAGASTTWLRPTSSWSRSLPVPRSRLHREGRQWLSAHPGGVEPGDLNVMVGSCMTEDERAFQAYSKIAEQITKEDGLVNQRLTWGASINGALLTLLGVAGGLFKDALRDAPIGVTIFVCAIAIFLSIIAALVCGWTIKGIVDARKQISYIREIYDKNWRTKIENELGLPRPFGVRDDTRRVDPWWGDNLFRLMIGLWVIVIVVCVVVAAYLIASVSGH